MSSKAETLFKNVETFKNALLTAIPDMPPMRLSRPLLDEGDGDPEDYEIEIAIGGNYDGRPQVGIHVDATGTFAYCYRGDSGTFIAGKTDEPSVDGPVPDDLIKHIQQHKESMR